MLYTTNVCFTAAALICNSLIYDQETKSPFVLVITMLCPNGFGGLKQFTAYFAVSVLTDGTYRSWMMLRVLK